MKTIQVRTPAHSCAVDITDKIAAVLRDMSARDGICLIYIPHTTAGLAINEGADPNVMEDILDALDRMVPWHGSYKHSEGNSAAHIKAIIAGGRTQVVVNEGKPELGTWERIFLLEFDGPRTRKIFVQHVESLREGS